MELNAINQYKQNTIATSTPEELTLFLYNGAIKFMNIAKIKIGENSIEEKSNALIRAQNIISELKYSLNMDYEMSQDIAALYNFILEKLVDANLENKVENIDEALAITKEMRKTWIEIMEEVKNESKERLAR